MGLLEKIIFVFVAIIVLYLFIKFLIKLIRESRTKISAETQNRADEIFNRLIYQFEQKYERSPNRNEIFRRAINASHIVEKKRGLIGHLQRQRIRKYLLEKNKIVRNYKIR
ncbi:MAG: hypothetical protein WC758_05835 [Candidatus Woesearchaeota archaeon]|jgi:hypothetical protein